MPSGGVAVSGRDDNGTLLEEISAEGVVIWERLLGLGKGSAITAIDGALVLAAIEKNPADQRYREDVAVWRFSVTGKLLDHRVVREGINLDESSYSENIWLERSGEAIYIFSRRTGFMQLKPFEVAKIDPRVGMSWRKELPATIITTDNGSSYSCSTATTVLPNGDLLVACRSNSDVLRLWRLSATNGASTESVVRLFAPSPNCEPFWSPARFLKAKSEGVVWLFGSPQASDEKPCGWIGEALAPEIR